MTEKLNMQDAIDVSDMQGEAANIVCDRFSDDGWVRTSVHVPSETELTIYINQQEQVIYSPGIFECSSRLRVR